MSLLTVETPFHIYLEFKIAPFHKRLLAWAIDMLIMVGWSYLTQEYIVARSNFSEVLSILLTTFPFLTYHFMMEFFFNGQSVGKMITGIKVMNITGHKASISQYILRWAFRLVDMGMTFGLGAILTAAFSKNHQRIGDLVAGTVVIDTHFKTEIADTIYLENASEDYYPKFPMVMQLSDRDINGIRNLLELKKKNKETEKHISDVALRVKKKLQIATTVGDTIFLNQLLEDYNYYTKR